MTSTLIGMPVLEFNKDSITTYFQSLQQNPINIITLVIDLLLVIFLLIKFINVVKGTRVLQLLKGIVVLIVITIFTSILNLRVLNYILTSFMGYGVLVLIVIFQPELRRALEQLGTGKVSRFFGIDKDIATKTIENIYKVVIAAEELAKQKKGALIVFERDIKLKDIIDTGVVIDSDISPQLLVNIFEPNTPLHDGAVIISDNKIMAAACMLPLADDKNISKRIGTRHRSAMGMSKESDSIVIVVSEETGKISVAKDGTLIADIKEEALKQILIKNVVTKRFNENSKTVKTRIKEWKIKNKKNIEEANK